MFGVSSIPLAPALFSRVFADCLFGRFENRAQVRDCVSLFFTSISALLQFARLDMLSMFSLPLAVFAELQLFRGVKLIALGQVVELPADRALEPDNDPWTFLCCHRQTPLYLEYKTKN